ncbi:MAG TPA: FAD-dependent oxidoreductase [Ferruginibacter sp.]|nr:FAD-dependent oxidoreductase [Ferruginibacter sp.]
MNLSSGYPYWLIRDGLPYDYQPLDKNISTDVAILGGGISGALVGWYLIKAGVKCIIVDTRTIGLGSTCASTSLLQYELDIPLCRLADKIGLRNAMNAYRQSASSIDKLEKIAGEIGFSQFKKCKSLFYTAYKKDIPLIKEEYNVRKNIGLDVQLMGEKDISTYAGFSAPAAILSGQAAQTDAYLFTHALHQDSIKRGALIFDRTNAKKIEHHKKGITIVTGKGYKINSNKLVYANGYEAVNYIKKKIVKLHSTYAVCSEQGNSIDLPFNQKCLLWNTSTPYLYMRTTPDNRVLIGGRDEVFSDPIKRDKLLPLKTKQLSKDFKKLFPRFDFNPEFSWCGIFGETEDGLPFIGPYKNLENSLFALGYGGNGITFSQIAAEILKDIITGKKKKVPGIFSFERV